MLPKDDRPKPSDTRWVLKFLWFYQYITDITEYQDGNDE
jgi:hypothetical protein